MTTCYRAHELQRGRGCYIFCREATKINMKATKSRRSRRRKDLYGVFVVRSSCLRVFVVAFLVGEFLFRIAATSTAIASGPPTFNQDVAPIFYSKCIVCHRAGEAAPMALTTYDDARPWARAIKTRVARREMPPWFADPRFGRELANNHSLTDLEVETIVTWV